MRLINLIRHITDSHYIVIGLAFFIGLTFPGIVLWATGYTTLILAIIFFLSALKIDLRKVARQLNDKWTLFIVTVLMLIVLPMVVYYIFDMTFPSLAVAFLVLSAMPIGMTAPLLTEIVGGRQSLALVLTVLTSLIAPITAPFVINFLVGSVVDVNILGMFTLLALVIYVPFFIAQFIKEFWQENIDRVSEAFKVISTLLLGFLITIIVAKQSDVIIQNFNYIYLGLLFLFFIALHFIGYFIIPWRDRRDKITISVCVTYMNFTLAIEIANKFFTDPNIILPIVLSIIPWAVIFIPFKRIMAK